MKPLDRFQHFLTSRQNLVGVTLAASGAAVALSPLVPVAFVAAAPVLYGLGVWLTPRSATYELKLQQVSADEIKDELNRLYTQTRRKLTKVQLERFRRIRDTIFELLDVIPDVNSADQNVFIVRQTAQTYLPNALKSYLSLPPGQRNLTPLRSGKTASELLDEQLELLEKEVEQIAIAYHKNDAQNLIAHGRFLEARFKDASWLQ